VQSHVAAKHEHGDLHKDAWFCDHNQADNRIGVEDESNTMETSRIYRNVLEGTRQDEAMQRDHLDDL
jgi:hypothetical protein